MAELHGIAHGGQPVVSGARVALFATSSTGYNGTLTPFATATTSSSSTFTLPGGYTCPSTQQAYIVATGGNPGTTAGPTTPRCSWSQRSGLAPQITPAPTSSSTRSPRWPQPTRSAASLRPAALANQGSGASTSSFVEYSPALGTFLSPNIGFDPGATYSSTTTSLSGGALYEPQYLAVDRSGALWALSSGNGISHAANLVQILGVAAPVDPVQADGAYGVKP